MVVLNWQHIWINVKLCTPSETLRKLFHLKANILGLLAHIREKTKKNTFNRMTTHPNIDSST